MNKEQFLAMSLPYELKAISTNQNYKGKVVVIDGIVNRYDRCWILTDAGHGWFPQFNIYEVNLCLRPLSDLTKEIEHKWERFVPIVELAKLAGFNTNNIAHIEFIEGDYRVIFENMNSSSLFAYTLNGNTFVRWFLPKHQPIVDKRVDNQLDLFLKLIEWHFDICGLIEKGEAIDVNTLSENPYK